MLWDVKEDGTFAEAASVDGTQGPLTCLAFDEASETLIQGSSDGTLATTPRGGAARQVKVGKGILHVLGHSKSKSGGSDVFWAAATDDCMRRYSVTTGALVGEPIAVKEFMVGAAWYDQAESMIITATSKMGLHCLGEKDGLLWSKANVVPRRPTAFACFSGTPGLLAIAVERPEGLTGGIASTLVEIFVLSVAEKGSPEAIVEKAVLSGKHVADVTALAIAPAGDLLASGDSAGKLFIWNLRADPIAVEIEGWSFHTTRIASLAWMPSGRRLVSGSLDQQIFVWDVDAPSERSKITEAHRGGVTAVCACGDDNKSFASVGHDGFLLMHEL